ncbi:M48 family metallopeptidase [Prauserella flavalba]|uniref:Peptidase M48 domain-containing protein n=1 Tax=Prauserella flavalba TaxID=1477506 RepID=A0A318LY56_9PSEU|nr:M48 family metallopeptidase [Prauserella flavalba]PXY37688.1 hypothetical protein BA062_03440 [Prauserella flavalba]
MRGSVRALCAVLLLVLFPFFVVALGVGGVIAGLTIGHRAGLYVAILAAGMMLALGLALVQALRTRLEPPSGPVLTRQEQPGLWRLVDELAAQAQTRPPDEIVLVGEINAAVREDARALGLKEGKRYMMIGLPLLAGLNVAELRSVLAHELGHYGGGHTRLLAVSYRGAETLGRTVSRLDSGPARWILNAYAWLYAVVSRSANRAQELQADAYSVAAAGRETAASALRKIATMDLLWEAYGDRFLGLPGLAGRTPDILLGFRNFLDHPQQRRIIAEIEPKVLDNQPSSLFDSHPTIRRRIEKIGALPEAPARPDQRPAWTVLADPARVIPAAEARLYIKGELGPRASWGEIVQLAGAASAARGAELLAGAGRASGAAPGGTLGELLAAIQHGRIDQLMSPLLKDGADPEHAREGLVELLGDVIVCALVAQRRVHHELNWGGGWLITGPQGELKIAELVAPAVRNPALVPQFAQRLAALGVRMDFVRRPPATPPAQPAGNAEPQLVGVAPEVMAFKKNWDVLVFDAGLLLVPLKVGKLAGQNLAGAVGQGGHAQRKRITRLLELGQAELFGQPGVRWLPTGTVLGGDRKKFLTGGGKIALRFTGGETATLRTQHDGAYETLTGFLDTVPQAQPAGAR